LSEVQDPSAVLAAHDFFPGFHLRSGRSGYFHVAAGTNAVLYGNHGSVSFAIEEAFELVEQIVVDLSGKGFSLGLKFLLLRSQCFGFGFKIG